MGPILSLWASKRRNAYSLGVCQACILFSLGIRICTPRSASKNDHHAVCWPELYLTNFFNTCG